MQNKNKPKILSFYKNPYNKQKYAILSKKMPDNIQINIAALN